jgi:hypothetical protein
MCQLRAWIPFFGRTETPGARHPVSITRMDCFFLDGQKLRASVFSHGYAPRPADRRRALDQEITNPIGNLGAGTEPALQDVLELRATDAGARRHLGMTVTEPLDLVTPPNHRRRDAAAPPIAAAPHFNGGPRILFQLGEGGLRNTVERGSVLLAA